MDVSRLPVPNIQELQHSFERLPAEQRELNRRKPPKLMNPRYHDSNGNRSFLTSPTTARLISFRTDDTRNGNASALGSAGAVGEELSSDSNTTTMGFEAAFTNLEKIGEGSFGEVFKVRSNLDGRLYAVKMSKQFYRGELYRLERLEEVRRCEQFSGQANCVRLYRAWEQDDRLYMQMELCRESLERYLERRQQIPENKIWSILLDLLLALKSLHDRNLIHLDIKLDNVLIGNDGSCKLADFGLVIDVNRAKRQATEGDSRYMAPEIMQGKFSKAADIFSLGIAMLELSCFLELPANGPLWQHLRSGALPEKFIKNLSPALLIVIRQMMSPQPDERPSVDQLLGHVLIREELRHRRRWQSIKRLRNNITLSRRFIRTKLYEWKRLMLRCLASLFTCLTAGWRPRPKPPNGRGLSSPRSASAAAGAAAATTTPAGNWLPSSLMAPSSGTQLNGKPTIPRVQILSSTPTAKMNGTSKTRLNISAILNDNSLTAGRHANGEELEHVEREDCCSSSPFTFHTMANSTPVNNHHSYSLHHNQSLRSRKDLTKTSFNRQAENVGDDEGASEMAENNEDEGNIVGARTNRSWQGISLDSDSDDGEPHSFTRKPMDTSSLVAKKLFCQQDDSPTD